MGCDVSNHFFVLLAAGLSSYAVAPGGESSAWGDEGTAVVPPHEPTVWTVPCSVGAGTRFTARTDNTLGTESSQPGQPFTSRVVTPVMSSCGRDYISAGAVLRGRVALAQQGAPPVLVLTLTDADTAVGSRPISATVRSGAGLEWIETNAGSSNPTFLLYSPWSTARSRSTSEGGNVQLTLPAGSLIEIELVEPVLILP